MKKFLSMIAAVSLLAASLSACGASSTASTTAAAAAPAAEGGKEYKVAIVQQLDHASLDEIRVAIEAELEAKAAEKGIAIAYKDFNGQNDATVLNQIGAQVVSDGYDAIIPIATLAATTMATATEDNQIPVIYAAISDPGEAQLTGIANVTGTSDALNTAFILDMMLKANPHIETVGLLYSNSEANSVTPIREAKEYLDSKGIAYLEKTGNTTDEILTAASAMVGRVQAVFTPTDNVVMAAASAVAEILNEAGIPHYTGADSFVTAGAFATCGVNYTDLGAQTADLAYTAMTEGMYGMEDYYLMDGGIITVNTDTCALIGKQADYACFDSMGEVVEVTTTKD